MLMDMPGQVAVSLMRRRRMGGVGSGEPPRATAAKMAAPAIHAASQVFLGKPFVIQPSGESLFGGRITLMLIILRQPAPTGSAGLGPPSLSFLPATCHRS